jgi:predicted  nucleic acid-binding Zn-ribbon protein
MNKVAIYLLFLSTALVLAQDVGATSKGAGHEAKAAKSVEPTGKFSVGSPAVEDPGKSAKVNEQVAPQIPKGKSPETNLPQPVPSSASRGSPVAVASVAPKNTEDILKKNEEGWKKNEAALRKYDDKLALLEVTQVSVQDVQDWIKPGILVIVLLQVWIIVWPLIRPKPEKRLEVQASVSSVQVETQEVLKQLKEALRLLTQAKTELSQQIKPLSEIAPKLDKALTDSSNQKGKLDALQLRFDKCEADCEAARAEVAPLQERINRLSAEAETLKSDLSDARNNLDTARSERETSRNSEMELRKDKDELSGKKSQLESELKSERDSLASAKEALLAARQAAETNGVQLEASFARLAPKFLADLEIAQFMRKLHGESLAGVGSATAAWSTLTAFASAEADPAAKDFLLHVLKRLGSVLVHYWKEQPGSSPKDRHERLSHWARCLNEHAQGRYNLFVPAIGAPVDRTKMSTLTSATVVQEVLCWQVRNPAGANYSLAEVA